MPRVRESVSPHDRSNKNADLWTELKDALRVREGSVRLNKVKGVHQEDKGDVERTGRVGKEHEMLKEQYFGNIYSDLWAGMLADVHALPADLMESSKSRNEEMWKIGRRIAVVRLILLKQHDQSVKEGKQKRIEKKDDQGVGGGRPAEPNEAKMKASEAADRSLDDMAKEAGHAMAYSQSGAATCQKCGNRAAERNLQS